jgi:transcription termination/antitermination protein NusG
MTKNWYVIHTYAGFEGRVKTSLMERASQMGLV